MISCRKTILEGLEGRTGLKLVLPSADRSVEALMTECDPMTPTIYLLDEHSRGRTMSRFVPPTESPEEEEEEEEDIPFGVPSEEDDVPFEEPQSGNVVPGTQRSTITAPEYATFARLLDMVDVQTEPNLGRELEWGQNGPPDELDLVLQEALEGTKQEEEGERQRRQEEERQRRQKEEQKQRRQEEEERQRRQKEEQKQRRQEEEERQRRQKKEKKQRKQALEQALERQEQGLRMEDEELEMINKRRIDKIAKKDQQTELTRIDALMASANTDMELLQTLDEEVFKRVKALNLDKKTAVTSTCQPVVKLADQLKSTRRSRTDESEDAPAAASTASPLFSPESTTFSSPDPPDAETLSAILPQLLICAHDYLTHLFPTSLLPPSILHKLRALGPSAYALGASTPLFNRTLEHLCTTRGNLDAIFSLLQEMRDHTFRFDYWTLDVLDRVKGNWEAETEMTVAVWRKQRYAIRDWLLVVQSDLREQELSNAGHRKVNRPSKQQRRRIKQAIERRVAERCQRK
ncbi:hypothetical protein LTR66_004922 [Elasticomyces elasticus]|nr:hypothetical protein LTR66_004922 [Elasticomyces elasticus]